MASPAGEDWPSPPHAARSTLSLEGGAPLPTAHSDSDADRRGLRVPAASTRPRGFRARLNRTPHGAELLPAPGVSLTRAQVSHICSRMVLTAHLLHNTQARWEHEEAATKDEATHASTARRRGPHPECPARRQPTGLNRRLGQIMGK